MKLAMTIKTTVVGLLGTMIWATVPGCGSSIGSLCNKVCDCTGCNDSQADDCVDNFDDARKVAEEEGCSSEFDAVLSCASSELTCKDDKVQIDGCDGENEALFKCSSKIKLDGIGGNACERYAEKVIAKYEGCGVKIETGDQGSGETSCSDSQAKQAACLTPCIDKVPCECVNPDKIAAGECTEEKSKDVNDCVSACSN
jgi:hypothetical protein